MPFPSHRSSLRQFPPFIFTLSNLLGPPHPQLPPNSTTPAAPPKRKRPAPPAPPFNPFARPDPFAQLAERDVAHVVSDVLYALEFFEKNAYLVGVEGRVGELDEEGGIEVLEEGGAVVAEAYGQADVAGGAEAMKGIVELGEEDMKKEEEEEEADIKKEEEGEGIKK